LKKAGVNLATIFAKGIGLLSFARQVMLQESRNDRAKTQTAKECRNC